MIFREPQVNYYVRDVEGLAAFYGHLGFVETFRTPEEGTAIHIELKLGGLVLGLASIEAAREMHHIPAGDGPPRAELVVWTNDVDNAFRRMVGLGAAAISEPHDFLADLRAAWVADPEGNPIQMVAKRG